MKLSPNWCATGFYTESHQTRNLFMAAIPIEAALVWHFSYRVRRGTVTKQLILVMALVFIPIFIANVTYHWRIRGFVQMLREYPNY